MRPLWCKEACWECGTEGYATRTQPRPADEPYYCARCSAGRAVAERYEAEAARLRATIEQATRERDEARAAEQLLRDLMNRIHVICEEMP
jgi:hypothetical protein